jgi:hypothetical protein
MNTDNQKIHLVLWTARILSIAFAVFISIFALDVFSENIGFRKTVAALFIHLLPTLIVVVVIVISWRKAFIGGIFYTILAILYIAFSWGKFDWTAYALIAGPLMVLGILFFFIWYQKKHQLV